jgi:hypothetical protein
LIHDRFATPEIAAFSVRESNDDSIRAVGWRILHEMRANGDPFAEEFIREIGLASLKVVDRLKKNGATNHKTKNRFSRFD